MDNSYQEKLDVLLDTIKNDSRILELKKIKKQLLSNSDLINKIKEINNSKNMYDSNTLKLKQELYQDKLYTRYQHLENEIYFLTLEMNKIINRLTDKKGCNLS